MNPIVLPEDIPRRAEGMLESMEFTATTLRRIAKIDNRAPEMILTGLQHAHDYAHTK